MPRNSSLQVIRLPKSFDFASFFLGILYSKFFNTETFRSAFALFWETLAIHQRRVIILRCQCEWCVPNGPFCREFRSRICFCKEKCSFAGLAAANISRQNIAPFLKASLLFIGFYDSGDGGAYIAAQGDYPVRRIGLTPHFIIVSPVAKLHHSLGCFL